MTGLCLAGAVLLAQFPQFYSRIQRLAGHLNEARRTIDLYGENAASLGLTLEQYIEQHLGSESEIFVSTGQIIVSLLERLHGESSFTAPRSPALDAPLIFLKEAELAVAAQTWQDFTPASPPRWRLIYAAAGLLLGWSCYTLISGSFKTGWLLKRSLQAT